MHGTTHDFIVTMTVKDGGKYPTGHGSGVRIDSLYPDWKYLDYQPVYESVLDVGSLDICGTQRTYDFCGAGPQWASIVGCTKYEGIDLIGGPSVDRIMNSHDLKYRDCEFDLVLCVNMLEHDSDYKKTIKECIRVTKKRGLCIFGTVDSTHPEHPQLGGGDTETYNKFTHEQLVDIVKKNNVTNIYDIHIPSDILIAVKK